MIFPFSSWLKYAFDIPVLDSTDRRVSPARFRPSISKCESLSIVSLTIARVLEMSSKKNTWVRRLELLSRAFHLRVLGCHCDPLELVHRYWADNEGVAGANRRDAFAVWPGRPIALVEFPIGQKEFQVSRCAVRNLQCHLHKLH